MQNAGVPLRGSYGSTGCISIAPIQLPLICEKGALPSEHLQLQWVSRQTFYFPPGLGGFTLEPPGP